MLRQIHILSLLLASHLSLLELAANYQNRTDSVEVVVDALSSNQEQTLKQLLQKAENSSDSDTILYYSKKAYRLAEQIKMNPARSLVLIGDGYFQSGNHTMALECYTKAAMHFEEEKNKTGLATVYSYISNIYNSQQNHDNATIYLKKAIQILTETNDSARLANALLNLGYAYYSIDKNDSALMLLSEAKKTYQYLGSEFETAYCIGNSGLVYSKIQQFDSAEKFLLNAIEVLTSYGDEYAVNEFINEYAFVLQQKGKLIQAISYARIGYKLAGKNNISEYKRDASFRLSELFKSTDLFDSAHYYLTEYVATSDSIKNFETIQRLADLRTEFEVAQKQTEVDNLKKNRIIQLIVIGALVIILLLAAWLIFLYYKGLIRERKFNRVLEERRKELEKRELELKELNAMKDRFFSIISHDLRSPISSLGGISFILKESMEHDNKTMLKQATDFIDQSVLSLSNLLDNLLNWALSQQGKLKFNEEPVDTKAAINEVVGQFTTVILLKNIQLKLDLHPNLSIYGDKNSFMTVMRNLLSNAFKFTEKGKEIGIISSALPDDWVEISVFDKGVGIEEDRLSDLFGLTENKSTRGTENEKGLGLGLNLVREFVSQNKGKMSVESKVGEGTRFILQFPKHE